MATLVEKTLEACNLLNLREIPKQWSDQAWENDFCDFEGLPDVLEGNVEANQYYRRGLCKLLACCRTWSTTTQDSTVQGFWNVLSDNDVSLNNLIAVIHAMVMTCKRSTKPGPKVESGVLSANIYLVLLQIPGSGAYRVFHSLLFQKCIDVLKHWPVKGSAKRKRSKAPKNNEQQSIGNGRRAKSQRMAQATHPQDNNESDDHASDDDDDDGSDEDDNEYGVAVISSEAASENIKVKIMELLQDLVFLLSTYSVRHSEQACHDIIQRLVDMTRIDASSALSSGFGFSSKSELQKVKSVSLLGYMGLAMICGALHGDVGSNTRTVLKNLVPNILMTHTGPKASVVKDLQLIKDNAVEFACYIAEKNCTPSQDAVRVLIQHLCTKCPDKADYRVLVAKAAVDVLKSLPDKSYSSLMEWITKYSKNAKMSYRVFALDFISELLLQEKRPKNQVQTDQETQVLTTKKVLLDILIGRCSDRAPTVRAKALQHLSQSITSGDAELVKLVQEALKEPLDKSVNSNEIHTVGSMIRKRTCDEKVGVRKAALQALESVVHLDLSCLKKPDVMMLHDRCMDPALSVRKQAMVSLTALLQEQPSDTVLQSLWLDAIFPLVLDRETTAQEKCYSILEDVILSKIVPLHRSIAAPHILAWNLLQIVASPSGQEVRRYLLNACHYWSKQNKLNSTLVKSLMSHINSTNNKPAWLLLSQMASASIKMDDNLVIQYWKDYAAKKQECDDETLCWVLSVIGSVSDKLPEDSVTTLTGDLQRMLSGFKSSPEIIAAIIGTLCKLCRAQPQAKSMIDGWCADLLKACEQTLSNVVLDEHQGSKVDDQTTVKNLFTVGEVAQLAPGRTTERLFMLVESMLISQPTNTTTNNTTTNNDNMPLHKSHLSSTVKAHAFVTLGKLCLQNENLAKKCIAVLARELDLSDDPAIRNNVIVVMCDLCVRYTSLVDRYIPNIATCLMDKAPLVRRQTLTLLTHLIQEDYVKWKGSLFYHFTTALVDEDRDIRKFADFCLVHLLLTRNPGMFQQHFVECIFHFNSFNKHKVFNKFPQTEREKTLFSLKGDTNASKRSIIYQFLLSHMSDEDRFNLTGKLCQEVLGAITDGDIPLDEESGALVKDALKVLCSKGIKLSSMRTKAADDMADEGDAAGAALVQARTKFLTQVLKKNMIENIIPIIIELKHMLEKQRSPLLKDLLAYLKEVMKDYRNEVQEVLSVDKQLANEIEFDLRKFEEEQKEMEEQKKRKQQETLQSPGRSRNPTGNTPDFVTPQLRSIDLSTASNGLSRTKSLSDAQVDPKGLPKTPSQARRHTLATAALLNSARKAMTQASRLTEDKRKKSLGQQFNAKGVETPRTRHSSAAENQSNEGRSPLAPLIAEANENQDLQPSETEKELCKTPVRSKKVTRAASTPEGNISHLSQISFCINTSAIPPPSPIPTSLPIRLYPKDKDAQPGLILKKGVAEDGQENQQDVICLPSPDQRLPKPRRWNVQSPDKNKSVKTKGNTKNQNNSIAQRTRSKRSTTRK
ncbi:condensin-2 complex subunit D3-like isoform X2 [Actinia tenebrosa]|uniref:Condensin-2 complex subunit D3-like isoform X2 n=1 Tax=Actinia tenebrosa TaxID=6105 RepID=A0A6P8HS77_ACTTE|nr:condensin-2 complex subunit D3-like isoform X2 [Actinia tenebrosa]